MATYVNDLRLKEIATGDESGTWGTSTNTNLELIAEAFSFGTEAITTNADTHTTTIADGSTDPGRSIYLKYTGTLDSACTITIGPNTVSKLWFIENGTSGSQNIIISQGSGANVTVPAGEVKAIYSDGAGSGAAMVDAFANLKVSDAAQTNITSLGTLTTLTVDDITINGSTISDAADLTVDVGGDIVLDADGGNVTFKDGGTAIGDLVNSSSDFVIESKVQDKDIIFKGDDGGSGITALTLDMSEAGVATFNAGATFGGAVGGTSATFNGGVTVDNITIDGTEIDLSSGDLSIDVAGNLQIDADDNGEVRFLDGGTQFATIKKDGNNALLQSIVADGDLVFQGVDGSSFVTAMQIDMSAAGRVGIGTTTPSMKVDIKADNGDQLRLDNDGDRFTQLTLANNGTTKANFNFDNTDALAEIFAGSGAGIKFSTNASESMRIASSGAVSITGSLSKGSGSFKINHPLESKKDTHNLYHSFVEAPKADNIYRGTVNLKDGAAEINLDEVSNMTEGTFVALNRDIQCYTSNETDFDAVKGVVAGNTLSIKCQNINSSATISWLVIGERQDEEIYNSTLTDESGKLIVEKLKSEEE